MTAKSNLMTTTVPLSQLLISETNVRKTGRRADPQLIASIKAKGILVPLIVRKNGKGYVIDAGGQRYTAAQALVAEGHFVAEQPIPVIVEEGSDADALETSLHENVIRTAMHPVDEYRAIASLHSDKSKPMDVDALAARLGVTRKHITQRLALGNLADDVLDAWRADQIDDDAAEIFTLCTSKKDQSTIIKKLLQQRRGNNAVDSYAVKHALKLDHNNPGELLGIIGFEAYEKRGGRITRDLFGSSHIVSDKALVGVMISEKIDETCKALVSEGWSWAVAERSVDSYTYGRIEAKQPNKEQAAKLRALEKLIPDDADDDDAAAIKAQADYDALEMEITRAAFTPAQKAQAGCFVSVSHHGTLEIAFGRVKPAQRRSVEAQQRATSPKGKKQAAARKGDDHVSNALVQRLSEQLTAATSVAITKEPMIAMAALLAGFASLDQACDVRQRGLATKKASHPNGDYAARRGAPAFNTVLATWLRKPAGELHAALAQVAAAALDFQTLNSEHPPLKDAGVASLCNALDGAALNRAIREKFDAKDYFEAVSRNVIVAAVAESMGSDHAANVGKMKKGAAAKFAIANVPKTKWLPVQLRTAHYDGPAKKVAKAGKRVKSKAKPKAKAKAKSVKSKTKRK